MCANKKKRENWPCRRDNHKKIKITLLLLAADITIVTWLPY